MTAPPPQTACFEVRRDDWQRTRLVREPLPPLPDGHVRLRVDRFALTANNVTYAVTGDALGYWRFFPAADGWGRVPAMGFADVAASAHPDVAEGERVFGFFPMATHLDVEVAQAGPTGFSDAARHRRETAPAYRQLVRTAADPLHHPAHEDALLLLRGLFLTSFLVDDFLAERDAFGAAAVLVSSASSKTAIALAHRLASRGGPPAIGLTSARNREFVAALGCYAQACSYEEIDTLPADRPVVLVDHSGDGVVVARVHEHFGDRLRHSAAVGATHWDAARPRDLPGPAPAFFFAPAQIQERTQQWGAAGFQERLAAAWEPFRAWTAGWLRVVRGHGPEALDRAWQDALASRARPEDGHVLSLAAAEEP